MSFQITTAFVQQYKEGVTILAQQLSSRLREAVTVETGIIGKAEYFDQIGATAAQPRVARHADTPLIQTPHQRRRVDLADYEWADLIDKMDKVKTLNDFTNPYVRAGGAAMARATDDIIINAMFGTALTGETGATPVTFPASQQVSVNSWTYGTGTGNAGLTISKLVEARAKLWGTESLMPGDEAYIAVSSKQIANLLATTEATSADFNSVKALSNGELNSFMGFNFIHTERLPVDGSGYRRIPVWLKSGVLLGIGMDITARISERDDKSYATQVYYCMSMGATRLEESKVVEIKALEV